MKIAKPILPAGFQHKAGICLALICLAVFACLGSAVAQLPVPASTQFDITGFLQEAALDPACANAHCGGTLKVNGHVVTVPAETIVILPANALTWQELFAQAPAPYAGTIYSGLAMTDLPAPLTTYEAHVIGNRVLGATHEYIAGLIYLSQQAANTGAGFINFMDYTVGEMRVGGVLNDPTTGARVRINDPVIAAISTGRYGRAMTPDQRFTADQDNPTITSATGFPMCFPRVTPNPSATPPVDDPLCPQSQRPLAAVGFATTIQMNDPINAAGVPPDATKQAPFEVGDYVTFAGTMVSDTTGTAGPWPGTDHTYISAHTISSNVAIYTWPGTNPAYVITEVTLIGTGGLNVLGIGEAAVRTRFEGFSTDPTRNVHLFGIDLDPQTGATGDRDWGTIGVDPGPPTGAIKGRWRFRPPCTATVATQKACTPPPAGTFLPPTREVRAVIQGAWTPPVPPQVSPTFANGIIAGQYHAPITDYIFPEFFPGTPVIPHNFNSIDFLAKGGYTSSAGTLVGQLNPWPDSTIPTPVCTAPVANAGGPYTVAFGGTVQLSGSATGTAPLTFAWTLPNLDGTLTNANTATPIYAASCGQPCAAGTTHSVSLTVTNSCGSNTATAGITIDAAAAPTVAPIAPVSVFSGANGSFSVSASDPANLVPITFTVAQSGTPALTNLTVTPTGPTTATVSFTAPTLPVGQITPSVVNLSVTATNTAPISSTPGSTTVTINPLTDAVVITNTRYRLGKQRLDITATSSVVSPNVTLTLQPYLTVNGTTFDPAQIGNVFTNLGGGSYSITIVGAPEPAVPPATPLVVKSNLGGVSPPHGLDRISN